MNSKQVADIVAKALDTFEYSPPSNTIGTPWSSERVAGAIVDLRASLITPTERPIVCKPPEVSDESTQDLWVVAATSDRHLVFFDPSTREFGLAQEWDSGEVESINVRGDLVGTFCAR